MICDISMDARTHRRTENFVLSRNAMKNPLIITIASQLHRMSWEWFLFDTASPKNRKKISFKEKHNFFNNYDMHARKHRQT